MLLGCDIESSRAISLKSKSVVSLGDDDEEENNSSASKALEKAFDPVGDCQNCYETSKDAIKAGKHMEKSIKKAWEKYENHKEKKVVKKEKKEAIQKVKDKQIKVEEKKIEKIEKKAPKKKDS